MELTNPYCSVDEANDFNRIREMLKPAGLIRWILLANKLSGYTEYSNIKSVIKNSTSNLQKHLELKHEIYKDQDTSSDISINIYY